MNVFVISLFATALVNLAGPGPTAPSYPLSESDTVLVIRVIERDPEALEPAAVQEGYAEARATLLGQPGYLTSTLYEEAFPNSPFRFVTLTAWESPRQMAEASLALTDLWEPGILTGQYTIASVRRREVRPEVGTYAIMVPFASGVDRERVLEQIRAFDEAAARSEGWLGSVTFTAAGGDPTYDLITLSSWASLDAARRYLGSGPIINLLVHIAREELIPPSGLSILRMASH
jgi:hypothetical protein